MFYSERLDVRCRDTTSGALVTSGRSKRPVGNSYEMGNRNKKNQNNLVRYRLKSEFHLERRFVAACG